MNVIIDTNLWVSFAIGKKLSVMRTLLNRPEMEIFICKELLDEFASVSSRLKIRKYVTSDIVQETRGLMEHFCHYVPINKKAVSSIRDKNDLWLLSFAETISADFIVTGDKDLLSLRVHRQTRIVTYNEFFTMIES